MTGELMAHGRVHRLTLGVHVTPVVMSRIQMRELDLLSDESVEVVEVMPGSAAFRAGLQPGDWIGSAGGRLVTNTDDLHRILAVWPADKNVPIDVVRGDQRWELQA